MLTAAESAAAWSWLNRTPTELADLGDLSTFVGAAQPDPLLAVLGPPPMPCLAGCGAVQRSFLDRGTAASLGSAVLGRLSGERPVEVVGAAYFRHHLRDEAGYFAAVPAAEALVHELALPVIVELCGMVSAAVGQRVGVRPGWAPPSFVSFDGGRLAGVPGDIHLDWDAFDGAGLSTRSRCWSGVVALTRPVGGSTLRLWPAGYRPGGPPPGGPSGFGDFHYEVGDLLVFDSHLLHQILPLAGSGHRTTLNFRLGETDQGWCLWF